MLTPACAEESLGQRFLSRDLDSQSQGKHMAENRRHPLHSVVQVAQIQLPVLLTANVLHST